MVLSSRDRRLVSVEMVWLRPSRERRRLRFSFQFNDVKDPDRLRRPHCLAPVAGGGGYLGGRPVPVNQTFQSFPKNSRSPRKTSKRSTPKPLRHHKTPETQGFQNSVPAAIRPGRRLSRGPPQPRQPCLSAFFAGLQNPGIQRKNHRGGSGWYSPERRGDRSKARNLVSSRPHGKRFSHNRLGFRRYHRNPRRRLGDSEVN